MKLSIQEVKEDTLQDVCGFPSRVRIDSILKPIYRDGKMTYEIEKLSQISEKIYQEAEESYDSYLTDHQKTIFLAYAGGQLAGQVILEKRWNQYAHIWDIRVHDDYRKMGIGRELINATRKWAKEQQAKGISLETQNNNVNACRFYVKCGFQLGGFDQYLYRALGNHQELPLHWYILFEEEEVS